MSVHSIWVHQVSPSRSYLIQVRSTLLYRAICARDARVKLSLWHSLKLSSCSLRRLKPLSTAQLSLKARKRKIVLALERTNSASISNSFLFKKERDWMLALTVFLACRLRWAQIETISTSSGHWWNRNWLVRHLLVSVWPMKVALQYLEAVTTPKFSAESKVSSLSETTPISFRTSKHGLSQAKACSMVAHRLAPKAPTQPSLTPEAQWYRYQDHCFKVYKRHGKKESKTWIAPPTRTSAKVCINVMKSKNCCSLLDSW